MGSTAAGLVRNRAIVAVAGAFTLAAAIAVPVQASTTRDATPRQECPTEANAWVTQDGSTYFAWNGDTEVYSGESYVEAIWAAIGSLTPGRTTQESVVVEASGSLGDAAIDLPSHTALSVCGTMDGGYSDGDGAIQSVDGTEDVAVPYLNMTGSPYFGLRFADVHGLYLGQINMELSGGLGIRFERDLPGSTDVTMDNVYVSGASSHAVETWNIDGLTIGTVTARDVGESGLLLQTTTNAEIGTVDGDNVATGTGYAVFRMANSNGPNVHVGNVIARGGGRGIFCVSQSSGAVIDNVDIAGTGNNAILIENCYDITIAAVGGTIAGPGDVRIAARDEFPNTSDVTLSNFTLVDSAINEDPCSENLTVSNIALENSSINTC